MSNVSEIYSPYENSTYCKLIFSLRIAIFRLGFLPAVAGCLRTVPCGRLPTHTHLMNRVRYPRLPCSLAGLTRVDLNDRLMLWMLKVFRLTVSLS